jgi:hypothetical protein
MMLGIPMSIDQIRKYLYGGGAPNLDSAIVYDDDKAPRSHAAAFSGVMKAGCLSSQPLSGPSSRYSRYHSMVEA